VSCTSARRGRIDGMFWPALPDATTTSRLPPSEVVSNTLPLWARSARHSLPREHRLPSISPLRCLARTLTGAPGDRLVKTICNFE
jgi:hypothetical protein